MAGHERQRHDRGQLGGDPAQAGLVLASGLVFQGSHLRAEAIDQLSRRQRVVEGGVGRRDRLPLVRAGVESRAFGRERWCGQRREAGECAQDGPSLHDILLFTVLAGVRCRMRTSGVGCFRAARVWWHGRPVVDLAAWWGRAGRRFAIGGRARVGALRRRNRGLRRCGREQRRHRVAPEQSGHPPLGRAWGGPHPAFHPALQGTDAQGRLLAILAGTPEELIDNLFIGPFAVCDQHRQERRRFLRDHS